MSGRLCCYKQQQHSELLAQFVFKVSAVRFNTRTKTRAPLPDCRINKREREREREREGERESLFAKYNSLIQFVPSCQDIRMQSVDVLDLHY